MENHIGIRVLRAKIKGFQAESEAVRRRIHKSKGVARDALWCTKRTLGTYSRLYMVAYGILRGVPYEKIEKCREQNKLSHARIHALVQEHGNWAQRRELTEERVKELLTVHTVPATSVSPIPEPVPVENANPESTQSSSTQPTSPASSVTRVLKRLLEKGLRP